MCPNCGSFIIDIDSGTDVTCTKDGITEERHCCECGEVIKAQEIVHSTGHEYETVAAVEPTYRQDGATEGKHCGDWIVEPEIIPKKTDRFHYRRRRRRQQDHDIPAQARGS